MKAEDVLKKGAGELGIQLTDDQVRSFLRYLEIIRFWNRKINLTGTQNEEHIVMNHFLDSITILPFVPENSNLLDLGSGAGFPGIPLKIAMPSLKVTLLDSMQKKVSFMREAIRKLKLDEIEAIYGRAEDIHNDIPRGYFDVAVSRAVSGIEDLLGLSVPYIKKDGKIILMRGKRGLDEGEEIKDRFLEKYSLLDSHEFLLPLSKQRRVILTYAAR